MAYLALVRHGESEWNAKGLWTGLQDIPLTEKGIEEAKKAGDELRDIRFDAFYTSGLIRAKQTLDEIKKGLNYDAPTFESNALNERNYGDLTGKNKWEIKKEVGDEEFLKIRRFFDHPIPNGESLKDVYNRVVPYYKEEILPKLIKGDNILVSAHGNSIRALIKYLEDIADDKISELETATGEVYIYKIDSQGNVESKEIRAANENKGKQ